MKIRNGFVSNSSSSSFVIDRHYLSENQVSQIIQHDHVCHNFPTEFEGEEWHTGEYNHWEIEVADKKVYGRTNMDNFDMMHFLKMINVPEEAIVWHS